MQTPGTRLGPYEVLGSLGKGGRGEVYRAKDTKLGREVAMKVIPDELARNAERMARFEREARVLAALHHPHIAGIYGLEETGTQRALVMEVAEGATLRERLAQGPIPLDEALEYAHEKGIVHRDRTPANVKVAPEGEILVASGGLLTAVDLSGASRFLYREVSSFDIHDVAADGSVLLSRSTDKREMVGRGPGAAEEQNLSWLDWSFPTNDLRRRPDGRLRGAELHHRERQTTPSSSGQRPAHRRCDSVTGRSSARCQTAGSSE